MRNILLALTTGVVLSAMTLTAAAGAVDERQPEARAYMNFAFGGSGDATRPALFYGLRFDYAQAFQTDGRPPLMAVEFSRQGFSSASVNGLPFAQRLQLNQAEETQWTAIDWGLLAAGVVGLGFAVAEVSSSEDESPDPTGEPGDGGDGGDGGGGNCLPGTELCLPFEADASGQRLERTATLPDLDAGTGFMGDLVAR